MRALPAIGLGAAALGNADIAESAAQATFEVALARGVGYFDTSPLYGGGLSEKRLGRALTGRTAVPFISTKVGYRIDFAEGTRQAPADRVLDFSSGHIRRSVEASLVRLGLDHVDLVYLHDIQDPTRSDMAVSTLRDMLAEGLIGGIGVGTANSAMALAMIERHDLDVVLIAGRHTLLDREAARMVFPRAASTDTAIVAGGVFNSGILADPVSGRFDYAPASAEHLSHARRLAAAAERCGTSLKAAALQFVASDPRVASTLLGAASAEELNECLDLLATPLAPATIAEIAAA